MIRANLNTILYDFRCNKGIKMSRVFLISFYALEGKVNDYEIPSEILHINLSV